MLISRVSPFSGKSYQREITVSQNQIDLWQNGMLIQRAMPNLTPDDQGVENDTEEESQERNYGTDDIDIDSE